MFQNISTPTFRKLVTSIPAPGFLIFPAKRRVQLYKVAAQMLSNTIKLRRVLETLKKIETSEVGYLADKRSEILDQWIAGSKDGKNLGLSMGDNITTAERLLLTSGVNTSRLAEAFRSCVTLLNGQMRMRKSIIENAALPTLLMIVLFVIIYICIWIVLPAFEDIIPIEKWYGAPLIFSHICAFIRDYILVILPSLLAVLFAIYWSLPNWANGKTRVSFDRYPPWSIYKTLQSSTFLLSVSSIEATGKKIDASVLNELASYSSPWQATRIRAIGKHVVEGKNLGAAMIAGGHEYPDQRLPHLIEEYYEMENPGEALVDLAQEQISWAEDTVKNAMSILNYVALTLITITIMGMGYSIFTLIEMTGEAAL